MNVEWIKIMIEQTLWKRGKEWKSVEERGKCGCFIGAVPIESMEYIFFILTIVKIFKKIKSFWMAYNTT